MSIITCKKYKIKRKRDGREESIYLDGKRSHEVSLTKLIVVKIAEEPLGIGDAIPPQFVLIISH